MSAPAAAGEQVLVVPRAALPELDGWHGIRTADLARVLQVIAAEARPHPRASAELDRSLKQVIPYLVLRNGPSYFLMRRSHQSLDASAPSP